MTAYVPPKVARWLTKEQRQAVDALVLEFAALNLALLTP